MAAASAAITVVLVVVDDYELVLVVVDDSEPHPAPASASTSAVAPTATENFRINPSFGPLGRLSGSHPGSRLSVTESRPVLWRIDRGALCGSLRLGRCHRVSRQHLI
jgi:hypothetical protein